MKQMIHTALIALTIAVGAGFQARAAQQDIVDTAVAAGSFNTLAAALKAAGLVETLKGPGPFTVFAPTDEAFAKLPAGTLESLLKPENKAKLAGQGEGCRRRKAHERQDGQPPVGQGGREWRQGHGRRRERRQDRYCREQWRHPRDRCGAAAEVSVLRGAAP